MFKFFAKLVGLEGWSKTKPKGETGEAAFQRKYGSEQSTLAEERRQANLRRTAERGQGEKDVQEEMEKLTNESNPS